MSIVLSSTGRQISDALVERIPGSQYDIYYRALEELVSTYVDSTVNSIINDTFITVADQAGLDRWQFFYTQKPYDMTYDMWHRLLLLLNQITRLGPTDNLITQLLQFFDPTASFSAVRPLPVYASDPGSGDLPTSLFYNTATHLYPTTEYVILDENSSFSSANEWIVFDESFVAYETSTMTVPNITYRELLQTLLNMLLPANVTFLTNFSDTASIVYAAMDNTQSNLGKELLLYEPSYNSVHSYPIYISGQENATLGDIVAVDDTHFLIQLGGAPTPNSSQIFSLDLNSLEFAPVFGVGFGGLSIYNTDTSKILILVYEPSSTRYAVYDKVNGGTAVEVTPAVLAPGEIICAATTTPGGQGVFATYLGVGGVTQFNIYVIDLVTGSVITSYSNVSTLANNTIGTNVVGNHIYSLLALSPTQIAFVAGQAYGGNLPIIHFLTWLSDTAFTAAKYIFGKDTMELINAASLYYVSTIAGNLQIDKGIWGADPAAAVSALNIPGLPNAGIFIINNDLIAANGNNQVSVVKNFLTGGVTPVSAYLSMVKSENLVPTDVIL